MSTDAGPPEQRLDLRRLTALPQTYNPDLWQGAEPTLPTRPTATAGNAGLWVPNQPVRPPEPEETESTGWGFHDLKSVLDGTYKPPQPTIGCRDDGVGLFYPGKLNSVAGESESGKTWLALMACLTEMNRGNHVVYLDFEDDAGGVIARLLVLGAHPDDILDRFHYVRPEAPPQLGEREMFMSSVAAVRPTLAVTDGVTEAMSMFGLELKDNTDVATFGQRLLRPFIKLGAAAVTLDHVVKNGENRGRYSLGGVHKLNGLSGVMYIVEPVHPFGIGLTGKSRVRVAKDRPAQIRRHALPGSKGALHWYADLVVKSMDESFAEGHLYPPIQRTDDAEATAEKEKEAKGEGEIQAAQSRVLAVLGRSAEPLSKKGIEDLVPGRASVTRRAVTRLVHEGRVTATPGARGAVLHSLSEKPGGES